ncbi:MAG: alpha/beta hydrolase [Cellulosilyticaceae bacterium]
MNLSKPLKLILLGLFTLTLIVCLLGFLTAYIPSSMSERHTEDITTLYFQDTGYSPDTFVNTWSPSTQSFTLQSPLGHKIPVSYIRPTHDANNKTVVLVHWHESNHKTMYPMAEIFLDKGWNVVLYDQRAHGQNTAPTVTFGYLESQDLAQVVQFAKDQSEGHTVGVFGQSMGAATIAYYLGTEEAQQNLSFAIMDSPYSSMSDEITWEISKAIPPILAHGMTSLGSKFCQLLYGYSFEDVNMVTQVSSSATPTLIIHSKADQKCPYSMSQAIFEAIPHTSKKLVTYENSQHLFAFWDDRAKYQQELFGFIE